MKFQSEGPGSPRTKRGGVLAHAAHPVPLPLHTYQVLCISIFIE